VVINKKSKIYVAGHNGMVGSALWRNLESKGYANLIGMTSKDMNLRDEQTVKNFFEKEKPEYVFLAAAKVGGIMANNTYRAEFIRDNLQIQNNVIHQSYVSSVKKLLFLGSSCIYPRDCPQPMKEEYLLTGALEQTNEPYAIAKIAGIKMCENYYKQYGSNFISVMPTNLYGPGDNFDLNTSHVIPALIRKFHEAKITNLPEVEVWGTGNPKREFLHVDDLADACIYLFENLEADNLYSYGVTHINIGSGSDLSIRDLANTIADVVDYKGVVIFNTSMPDGTPRKLLDVARLEKFGWKSKIDFHKGLLDTYLWYLSKVK